MTARQQLARLLPLVLLVVLVITVLRGAVPAPRWNGPLKADGIAIGIALEACSPCATPLRGSRSATTCSAT
jgi:hypothetical protein